MHSVHPTPKFSIITVTYNAAEKVLEDTIQSVISQTYHHIEYIIVDGAFQGWNHFYYQPLPPAHTHRCQRTGQRTV